MDPRHDIPVRCARDRLIDLLGLGEAYPLTDLTVAAVPPKVVFGTTASRRRSARPACAVRRLHNGALRRRITHL